MLRSLARTLSTSSDDPFSKYLASYQYRMDVPVDSPRFIRPVICNPVWWVNAALGPGPSNTAGTPCANDIWCTLPSRFTVTSNRCDSAFTADAPTPCRPPEVL